MPGPGETYYGQFVISNFSTGAAQDADSLPVATATHAGADDGAFVLSVASLATGRYLVSGAIPDTYVPGDQVLISATATVNSVANVYAVDSFSVSVVPTAIDAFPFYMALSTNGRSPATNVTVTALRSDSGAPFVPCDNSPLEIGNGLYVINLTAADLAFTSSLVLLFTASGCDNTWFTLVAD